MAELTGSPGSSGVEKAGFWRQAAVCALLVLPCFAVYSRVTPAFFCSYDDFYEVHRAAFEDSKEPARIFTTAHGDSDRYRPLNRAANFLTYRLGGLQPFPFRLRNLCFHAVSVVLAYFLGSALFSSWRAGAFGALLFGLHPLANMSIVGAVVTNPLAYAFVLGACLLFVVAIEFGRFRPWLLAGALSLGWLGLLTYDPAVVVFFLMPGYLLLRWLLLKQKPDLRTVSFLGFGSLALLAVYFVLRLKFVPHGFGQAASYLPNAGRLVKNGLLYAFALISPIDPVLGNLAFGAPLPSEIRMEGVLVGVLAIVLALAAVWVGLKIRKRVVAGQIRMSGTNLVAVLFLFMGIVLSLIPVLLFGKRASETYVYLPVAFWSLLIGYLASRIPSMRPGAGRTVLGCAAVALLALAALATWLRNERVSECGAVAARILAGIPCPERSLGAVTIEISGAPGGVASKRYGFYGFRGTDTIGDGVHADPALSEALQLFCSDPRIRGAVVSPDLLRRGCASHGEARVRRFWVADDGSVAECRVPSGL